MKDGNVYNNVCHKLRKRHFADEPLKTAHRCTLKQMSVWRRNPVYKQFKSSFLSPLLKSQPFRFIVCFFIKSML